FGFEGFLPFEGQRRRFWRHNGFFAEMMYEYLCDLRMQRERRDGLLSIPREEARETFLSRASDFVATRFASIKRFRNDGGKQEWHRPSMLNLRQRLGGPQVNTPGCQFTVSTNSNGLRVFWSGAYYVTPNNFNHPTSPTSSVLQSGTYVFGVDGGNCS